ncbi:kelch motif domain-containing protein, putative [Eimeria brunetti]|uniref:Kelch motif domain-containing protein, putative n=1 Tax=Eimeria brunetti TaxID=51314 RepID=U6LHF9_9EIME|nr:kelch motif domain-containing protein, putative [Eimeria brunetti]
MAPPKGNTKKAQQKAARRELQQKKAAAKEQKKKQKKGEVDCDETPIDVLLQQLEEEHRQRQISRTVATPCNQPSPRAHASLTLLPSGDFLLFGGESYDGKKVRVYGDLFKWDMDKGEWRRLESPEMPRARCSHQAVYHNSGDSLYTIGASVCGIFTESFPTVVATRRWYRLELKNGKKGSAKKRAPKQVGHDGGQAPLSEDKRVCESETGEESSGDEENWQKTFAYFDTKGRLVKLRLEDLPEVNRDVATCLDTPLPQNVPKHEQRIEGAVSSCGGESSTDASTAVCDLVDGASGDALEPITSADAPEGEAQQAASKVAETPQSAASLGPFEVSQAQSVFSADVPLPRLHGMICVRGSSLVLMGGLMELGSKEITLDDCWSLNLNKRDRWVRVLEGTMHEQEWQGAESEAESSDGSDSENDSSHSDSGSSESDELDDETSSSDEEGSKHVASKERKRHRVREEMQQLRERFGLDDPMETPAEGESLRDFFERTKEYWIQKARAGGCSAKNNKEMTREAFEAASARVSTIRDALHRMDELQRLNGSESEERDSCPSRNHTGSASRHRG